jgi:hypothetical protein
MPQTGRRKAGRLRVELPAQLLTLDGHPKANLCDISRSGARLRISHPLKIGDDVVINWLNFEGFGHVVWVKDEFAGVEFYDPIDEDILLKTREIIDYGLDPGEEGAAREAARNWYLGYR